MPSVPKNVFNKQTKLKSNRFLNRRHYTKNFLTNFSDYGDKLRGIFLSNNKQKLPELEKNVALQNLSRLLSKF